MWNTRTHRHTHTYAHTYAGMHEHIHMHADTRACITCVHMHTHTHTRTTCTPISLAVHVMLCCTLSGGQGHISLYLRANTEDGRENQTSKLHAHEKERGIPQTHFIEHPLLPLF